MLSSAPGMALTTYVDTSNDSWSFDFGNPLYNSSYATSEVAVAKAAHRPSGSVRHAEHLERDDGLSGKSAAPSSSRESGALLGPVELRRRYRLPSNVGGAVQRAVDRLSDDPWEPNDTYLSASPIPGSSTGLSIRLRESPTGTSC